MAGQTVSPQAEQAGSIVEETVAAAETNAAVAIETAAAQVEAAQQTAADIAAAAIETDLGRQIAAQQERFNQWQSDHQAQMEELREDNRMIQDGLTQALERLASALSPQPVVITEPPASIPTPQPPADQPPIAVQGNADGPPAAPTNPPAVRKPARRAI